MLLRLNPAAKELFERRRRLLQPDPTAMELQKVSLLADVPVLTILLYRITSLPAPHRTEAHLPVCWSRCWRTCRS
jgi:hypothetical protein